MLSDRSLSQRSKRLFTTFVCRLNHNSQRRDMGSPIDSSRPSISATEGALLPLDFAESGGYSRKEAEAFCPAVGYVSDDHRAFLAPENLPALAPQAPEATGPSRLPGSGRLDKLYQLHFQRLDLGLEVLKAQQLTVPELRKVLEGNAFAQIHVPSSVTEGCVPALDVLDVKAEGGVVYGSVLVERKAGVRK